MNKKIIILTIYFLIGVGVSFFTVRYFIKTKLLEINELEIKEEEEEEESKQEKAKKIKKEIVNIPWTYTWKGEFLSLPASFIISFLISATIIIHFKKKIKKIRNCSYLKDIITLNYLFFFTFIFDVFIFRFLFALEKFKNKNYFQRFLSTFSYGKIIIDFLITIPIAISIYLIYKNFDFYHKHNFCKFLQMFFVCCYNN